LSSAQRGTMTRSVQDAVISRSRRRASSLTTTGETMSMPMPDATDHRRRSFRGVPPVAARLEESNSKRELDRRLDQALEDTFPASDPVAILV
jgi:hypothetical protein